MVLLPLHFLNHIFYILSRVFQISLSASEHKGGCDRTVDDYSFLRVWRSFILPFDHKFPVLLGPISAVTKNSITQIGFLCYFYLSNHP